MQQVVNKIYWAPTFDAAFGFGSKVKRQADGTVIFRNPFMTSGVGITGWSVSSNYQAAKTVPQLPHLVIGHQYRLVLHGVQEPRNTVIIRLEFFDPQWQVLKKYDFTSQNVYFTVPDKTVNFNLSLINAGNHQLTFHRIEICDRNLPAAANQELWFQKRVNAKKDRPLRLLLVNAGQRSKMTYPQVARYADKFPYQVVVKDTQYHGDLVQDILDWLNQKREYRATIISCDPALDQTALQLQTKLPSLKTLVTSAAHDQLNAFDSWDYQIGPRDDWMNNNLVNPNWYQIFRGIREQLGGA